MKTCKMCSYIHRYTSVTIPLRVSEPSVDTFSPRDFEIEIIEVSFRRRPT